MSKARAALRGERQVLAELSQRLLCPRRDNLVERPWGGRWIERFKSLPDTVARAPMPWGEAFEISAFASDAEAARYPSRLGLDDGSELELGALLEAHAEHLLGESFVRRHGACFPLLPKTLDVKELLSVQGHPPGHTEVYIIIDAEPGATLRLGFSRDIDAGEMETLLTAGIARQRELLDRLGGRIDALALHAAVAPWFATRDADTASVMAALAAAAGGMSPGAGERALLEELKALYWYVLDAMNAIEVRPGQVIFNATPARLLDGTGAVASAEVHALGNPEGREILALEIRQPGPTFRAWDNVRFPAREVDIAAALRALNLRATSPEEFIRERVPVPDRDGVSVSVDCESFRIEHLAPAPGRPVAVPASVPHALHCLAGDVEVFNADGRPIGRLASGESALVPVAVGPYRLEAEAPADVVCVTLPAS